MSRIERRRRRVAPTPPIATYSRPRRAETARSNLAATEERLAAAEERLAAANASHSSSLRRARESAAFETRALRDRLGGTRRETKRELASFWSAGADFENAARRAAETILAPRAAEIRADAERRAEATHAAAYADALEAARRDTRDAREETRTAKEETRTAKEALAVADERAREEIRRVHEDARRDVREALEKAKSEVEDANAAAWLATVELTALKGGVPAEVLSERKGYERVEDAAAKRLSFEDAQTTRTTTEEKQKAVDVAAATHATAKTMLFSPESTPGADAETTTTATGAKQAEGEQLGASRLAWTMAGVDKSPGGTSRPAWTRRPA